jgi:hypothetical protein
MFNVSINVNGSKARVQFDDRLYEVKRDLAGYTVEQLEGPTESVTLTGFQSALDDLASAAARVADRAP